MKILFKSYEESRILSGMIVGFEDSKRYKTDEEFRQIVEDMRTSVHLFNIKNIGMVGIMICGECKHKWTAICSEKSKELVCPKCTNKVHIEL